MTCCPAPFARALRKMNVGDGWAARIARAALEDGE